MRINSEMICLGAGARGLRGKRSLRREERPVGDGGPHVAARRSPVANRAAGARGLRGKRCPRVGNGPPGRRSPACLNKNPQCES